MGAEMSRCRYRGQRLLVCASVLGILSTWSLPAQAQDVQTLDTITITTIGRTAARPRVGSSPAVAPVQAPQQQQPVTQEFSAPQQSAIDTLAPVSVITLNTINTVSAKRLSDIFYNVPGVSFQERGDTPETSINIRGLQDFGRVAVVVDGARQNYQRTGHNANGGFFLEPELLGGVEIVRGPTANVYGSGAIGGVVAFRTKDVDDILKPGERIATAFAGMLGSNSGRGLVSAFTAVRGNPNVDFLFGATHRMQSDYKDGDGTLISNTANHISTGLAKATFRPADGHEIKFGAILQEDLFNIGQFNRGPVNTDAQRALNQGSSVYSTDVRNTTGTVRWKYYRPDDNIFNWDVSAYSNRTNSEQTKIYHLSTTAQTGVCSTPGNNISGCVGDKRGYLLETLGFDANNTMRFNFGEWRNAVTFGGDLFQDDVTTTDSRGNSNITTPGGVRTVSGAFVQWKSNYSTWLEVVSAARYDNYKLESTDTETTGERVSPKITVGITPVKGVTPYVSYAEGYRAPSITETLIAGAHATGGGPTFFNCPGGGGGLFCFLQNPKLRPEVGKTQEAGINLKFDNIFTTGDSFRGKINVFRNNLEDYIELIGSTPTTVFINVNPFPPPVILVPIGKFTQFYQYQNIDKAHIQGFEAETMYDAGNWFLGVSGQIQRGYNDMTGQGLSTIQPNKIVTTGGVRLLERKLTIGGAWISAASNQNVPENYLPNTSYDLVNLFLTYEPAKDLWLNFTVDNALNRYYRPYAIPRMTGDGTTQNDVLWAGPPPGVVYKGTMRVRFSAM
jgi:hemoglobin/transferrin/lactoferrin receptor protein